MSDLDDIKGEMLATSLSAEEEDRLKGKLSWNEHLEAWELPGSSFSDYGGSLVDRSNSAYWLKKYPDLVELRHGGHNSVWTVIPEEKLNTIDGADLERIIDDLDSLEDYPLLDEDGHSNLQMEAQWEAWDEDYRDEYRKELLKKFGGYGLNAFAAAYVPNDVLDEIERENDNGDWEEQDGGTMWRNVKRLAEKTDADDILGNGEMAKLYRKAKLDAWNKGFDDQFIDALMKRFGHESGVVAAITRNVGMFDLADSLLESVNGWAIGDPYTSDTEANAAVTMLTPDWEDLQPAIDDMHPSRITQAASHVKDPKQLTLPLKKHTPTARVVADSLLERSQVIGAPSWLVERMERIRKMPPPTLEQVRQQFEASREQSFKTDLPDRYS